MRHRDDPHHLLLHLSHNMLYLSTQFHPNLDAELLGRMRIYQMKVNMEKLNPHADAVLILPLQMPLKRLQGLLFN
jgi:hypothetical protein